MRTNRDQERKAAKAMGIAVSIFGIFFVVIWCVIAASIGAWFMLLFAIPIIGFWVFRLVLTVQLGKQKDPWGTPDRRYPNDPPRYPPEHDPFGERPRGSENSRTPRFCHSCSYWVHNDFQFCPRCGRRLF